MLEFKEFEKLYTYAEVTILEKNIGNTFQEVVYGGIIIIQKSGSSEYKCIFIEEGSKNRRKEENKYSCVLRGKYTNIHITKS